MKTSARNSRNSANALTKEQKEALDLEAKNIMEAFAVNMRNIVTAEDEANVDLLQQHFDWAKKFVTTSKVEYLNMVKKYSTDQRNLQALNSIEPGLPVYVKTVAMRNIHKIK